MKEKLIIKNFGPIKSVELDLGRFNILIGEQATGKSTVAKVLAVCRYFSYIIGDKGSKPASNFATTFSDGLEAWGLSEYVNKESVIEYWCKHYSVVLKTSIDYGRVFYPIQTPFVEVPTFNASLTPLSKEFKTLLSELEKITPQDLSPNAIVPWTIPTSFFLNDVKRIMDNPFYLPTQRGLQSIFDIGKNSISNLSSALFNQLSKMDGIARLYKQETYIEPLNIYYVNRDGHGFIRKADETQYYSLYNAASGYQSMIPIVFVIKYYTEIKKKNKTFLIEEAEQNLFPSAQNKLMQYLVEKTFNIGSSVLLTTHSPYILTSLNNMMYAYQVGQNERSKTPAIIPEKYWINPREVSAYMMKSDGTLENIIDEEGLVKAEKIDEVSSKVINKEFNEIMDIEIATNEKA